MQVPRSVLADTAMYKIIDKVLLNNALVAKGIIVYRLGLYKRLLSDTVCYGYTGLQYFLVGWAMECCYYHE